MKTFETVVNNEDNSPTSSTCSSAVETIAISCPWQLKNKPKTITGCFGRSHSQSENNEVQGGGCWKGC